MNLIGDNAIRLRFRAASTIWFAAVFLAVFSFVPTDARAEGAPLPDCGAPPPSLTVAQSGAVVTIDPSTEWQPRNGEVLFTISGPGRPDRVAVCLRWRSTGNPNVNPRPFVPSPLVEVVAATPDGNTKYSAVVPDLPFAEGAVERTGSGMIPVADFRVIATGGDLKKPIDVVERLGVTSKTFSAAIAFFALAVMLTIIGLVKTRADPRQFSLFRIVSTSQGAASISQFQIMLWTCVIGASAAYVMALSGTLVDISDGTLALLGISGVAVFGAALKQRKDTDHGASGSSAKGWVALVKDGDSIDPTRLQMLFFTVLTAAFVVVKVINDFRIPEIPASYQLLMGMSNGIYLGAKYIRPGNGSVAAAPPGAGGDKK